MEPERDILRPVLEPTRPTDRSRPVAEPSADERAPNLGKLVDALNHPHPRRREEVIQALSALPTPEAFDAFVLCLDDEDATVRARAADALGNGADPRATLPLLRAVYDTDSEVRFRAAFALEQLRPAVGTALRIRAWEYVAAHDVRNVYALCNLSLAHFAAEDFAAAESVALRAIRTHPDYFYPYTVLAQTCAATGAFDAAREAYHRALELHPNHVPTRLQLAELYRRRNAFAEALAEYEEVARVAPNEPDAHFGMGVCLTRLNATEKAIRCYRRCLRLDPERHLARNNLGILYKRQGMLADAIHEFQQAVLSRPDYDPALANLGDCVIALFQAS